MERGMFAESARSNRGGGGGGGHGADLALRLFGRGAFRHRFALWRAGRVEGFVAYSAAWWDEPTEAMAETRGLVMCGEADPRFEASQAFACGARELGLPVLWRSYRGVGHELTPAVIRMAQAFLAETERGKASKEHLVGDLQSYRFFAEDSQEARDIPEECRVELSSRAVAEAWARETN